MALCVKSWANSVASEWTRAGRACPSFENGQWRFNLSALSALVGFVVGNTFVLNNGVLRKQVIGIPMGTNPGPDLANLYLYAYESTFVDKLVKIHGVNAAKFFRYSFRLIDDVFSVDNCFAFLFMERANTSDVVLGGVYPGVLTLNETTTNVDS